MEWTLLGFLALAALYVWRSAVSFVPPLPSAAEGGAKGRDAHAALSSLLAQSVRRAELVKEIGSEWKHSLRYVPNAAHLSETELARFAGTSMPEAAEAYLALARRRSAAGNRAGASANGLHGKLLTGETKLVP